MINELFITFVAGTVLTFILTVLAEHILIPVLRSHKLGQRILDIGPRWHKSKEGTPIMGGIGFILAMLIVTAAFFVWKGVLGKGGDFVPLSLTIAYAVANGSLGFVDDYCKLIKKQNEGLTRMQKLVLQVALAIAYVCMLSYMGYMDTAIDLPFGGAKWELGFLYYPMAVVVLTGVVNGGNITDGIDGLASSITCVIGAFFGVVAFRMQDESLSLIGALLIGATLGFLIYNFHPARVFMGDTGSLFLGALVIASAFSMGWELIGLLICAVFVLEMLSSFWQILYFKLTHGKRFFKMAPFHHHLEQCGWGEVKIVAIFSMVEFLFCMIAYFALGI